MIQPRKDDRQQRFAEFVVYGIAQPQGNKTGFVVNGRAVLREGKSADANRRFKAWREAVAVAARAWQATHHAPLMEGAVALETWFYLPRPKHLPKRVFAPIGRPDYSKLLRAAEDSLKGIVWRDDSQVVDNFGHKRFATDGPPCAVIRVREIPSVEYLA